MQSKTTLEIGAVICHGEFGGQRAFPYDSEISSASRLPWGRKKSGAGGRRARGRSEADSLPSSPGETCRSGILGNCFKRGGTVCRGEGFGRFAGGYRRGPARDSADLWFVDSL